MYKKNLFKCSEISLKVLEPNLQGFVGFHEYGFSKNIFYEKSIDGKTCSIKILASSFKNKLITCASFMPHNLLDFNISYIPRLCKDGRIKLKPETQNTLIKRATVIDKCFVVSFKYCLRVLYGWADIATLSAEITEDVMEEQKYFNTWVLYNIEDVAGIFEQFKKTIEKSAVCVCSEVDYIFNYRYDDYSFFDKKLLDPGVNQPVRIKILAKVAYNFSSEN